MRLPELSTLAHVSLFTFFLTFKPSEPFLYPFMSCVRKIKSPTTLVFPYWTYAQLAFLPVLALASELIGYRSVVITGVVGRLSTLIILLSGTTSLRLMQLSQICVAAGFAAYPALVAIMYRLLPAQSYAKAVGVVACSGVVAEVTSSLLGQFLEYFGVEYIHLFVISLVATTFALVFALLLPSPPPTKTARALLSGQRPSASAAALLPAPLPPVVNSIRSSGPPGSGELGEDTESLQKFCTGDRNQPCNTSSEVESLKRCERIATSDSIPTLSRVKDSFPLLLNDLGTALLRSGAPRWYLWLAMATAVHHLVLTYWQAKSPTAHRDACDVNFSVNGWVMASASLVGGVATLVPLSMERQFSKSAISKFRRVLVVLVPFAMGLLLMGLWKYDQIVYYACFVAYHVLFELMRVICDAQGARCVARASYKGAPRFALVCGLSTTISLLGQTGLQIFLSKASWKSNVSHYFLVFSIIMFALFALYCLNDVLPFFAHSSRRVTTPPGVATSIINVSRSSTGYRPYDTSNLSDSHE